MTQRFWWEAEYQGKTARDPHNHRTVTAAMRCVEANVRLGSTDMRGWCIVSNRYLPPAPEMAADD